MIPILQSQNSEKLLTLALLKRAEPFTVQLVRTEHSQQTEIRLRHIAYPNGWKFGISDGSLLAFKREQDMLDYCFDVVDELKKQAYADVYSNWGEYPDIRLWAAEHGNQIQDHGKIPGWIFPRWNSQNQGMKALKTGGIVDKNVLEESVIDDDGREIPMAATKRTVTVVKGGTGKTKKPKNKPMCIVHTTTEMKFNTIRNLWECPEELCNVVSRPKTDTDAGQVIMGKGAIELRLVFTDKGAPPRVILMADNNVVIDITDHVNAQEFIDKFDVRENVAHAKNQGVSVTRVASQRVPLSMSLVILGIENA